MPLASAKRTDSNELVLPPSACGNNLTEIAKLNKQDELLLDAASILLEKLDQEFT